MRKIRRTCSLCGGRLSGHICVECGLDNSKNDDNYIFMKDSHRDSEQLTHSHTKYEPMAGKTINVRKEKWSKTSAPKEEKKVSKVGIIVAVFIAIANIVPAVFSLIGDLSFGSYEPVPEYGIEEIYPEDPYAYVTRELSDTGLNYETELTAGTYKGGVHIPEGTYEVVILPDEETGIGDMVISMNDAENGIYYSVCLGEYEGIYNISDFRVYAGGVMDIEGRGTLLFGSSNAQSEAMYWLDNPNTQNYYVKNEFEVGVDVVPGVYDVYVESGSGIFDYEVMTTNGYMVYQGKLIGDPESGFAGVWKNVVLPEGTTVYIDDMEVQLVPSEKIESKDYWEFYDNY